MKTDMKRGTVLHLLIIVAVAFWVGGCMLPPPPPEGAPVIDRSVQPIPGGPPTTPPQVEVNPLPRRQPVQPQQYTGPVFEGAEPVSPTPSPGAAPDSPDLQPASPPPAPAAALPPQGNQAVVALLDSAADYVAEQEWDNAAAALERALRIEPSNAGIWHDLAQIRLQQRQYEQAESLAAKSNTLASNDDFIKIRNWRLIAIARRAMGDEAGADAAEAQALAIER